ncbi:MAG: Lrp/AsnC family transcriptional regulator [Oscillospiraceae bacterium]|nr:Lrp/AsnC family transcriptional regulator [Oscillospiraceae bacterium]MBQ8377646.1 Lrp/AsnC family transcriptional regulator [Oscillospiraceae bacterium]MBQ8884529.1 Lrp/AsnC family transcriptional regulator [Oscillospiraceae bacterium]
MDALINLLKTNARLTNAELAVMLDTDEKTIATCIETLEEKGIIKGYTAIVNDELVDDENVTALIEVKVTPQSQSGFDAIARTIASYEEVEACTLMSGTYDLCVTVSGKNLRDISLFVAQRLAGIEGVLSTATNFVLKRYKDNNIVIIDEETDERGLISP